MAVYKKKGKDAAEGEETGHDARRSRTRQALIEAALDLLGEERTFSSLSLREVTKAAGVVPAAFYRHFRGMDSLGLELVDESFRALRTQMRDIRAKPLPTEQLIRSSVALYVAYVRAQNRYFRFAIREYFSGATSTRLAIRNELRFFVSELATDLALLVPDRRVTSTDLQMIAQLVVNNMVMATDQILALPSERPEEEERLVDTLSKQLRVIFLGVAQWNAARPDKAAKDAN
ncbi:MAG: TetR family transcriptional regulator [Moraxellaceae bacterium]|jgi:AcrR family transcriptional regulator|nr:TetR family transcriptional regulator [Moraxellaceae bacterium]